ASTSYDDCVNTCDKPGEQLGKDEECAPCARGTYKEDGAQLKCDGTCPYGLTTAGDGSTSMSDCTIVNCPERRIVNTSLPTPDPSNFNFNAYCTLCSRGFAQPAPNQTECAPCKDIRDAANYPSCTSECDGPDDTTTCKDGFKCTEIMGSKGYYECTKNDSDTGSKHTIHWWAIAIIAVGVIVVAVVIAILIWCCYSRRVFSSLQKPAKAERRPTDELDQPARRITMMISGTVEDAEGNDEYPTVIPNSSH
ncbi:hypothetical protein PMAYCL1PPCAC_10933, partial [Pristionchus mayeri]